VIPLRDDISSRTFPRMMSVVMAASGAAFYVTLTLSGVLASLVHCLANPLSTEPTIGASGAGGQ